MINLKSLLFNFHVYSCLICLAVKDFSNCWIWLCYTPIGNCSFESSAPYLSVVMHMCCIENFQLTFANMIQFINFRQTLRLFCMICLLKWDNSVVWLLEMTYTIDQLRYTIVTLVHLTLLPCELFPEWFMYFLLDSSFNPTFTTTRLS